MEEYVPKQIAHQIKDYLRIAGIKAEKGWKSASAEEDALTGDLGATLRKDYEFTRDDQDRVWAWGIDYKKFRGRGPGAPEKLIGADGIFEIRLSLRNSHEVFRKGMLFQSKKAGATNLAVLQRQGREMESVAPGGSCIVQFGANGYKAFDTSEILNVKTIGAVSRNAVGIGDYLADSFFACKRGLLGMSYDGGRSTLYVPDKELGVRGIRGFISHRLEINIRQSD